jgi:hypothetical protein
MVARCHRRRRSPPPRSPLWPSWCRRPPGATEPASTYDADGQRHADACLPAGPDVQLRYLDGTPTGFAIPEPLTFTDGSCPSGDLRIDLHEIVDSPVGPLVFTRGGNGYTDDQNAK